MKGFIEVNFADEDKRTCEANKIKVLVNIEHIFYIKEDSYIYRGETPEVSTIIVMKSKNDDYYTEIQTVETYEEIKQKIKEAQGE